MCSSTGQHDLREDCQEAMRLILAAPYAPTDLGERWPVPSWVRDVVTGVEE